MVPSVAASQPASAAIGAGGLTLQAALREALRQSPDLRPADDAAELARVSYERARAQFALQFAPNVSTQNNPGGLAYDQIGLAMSKRTATGAVLGVRLDTSSYGNTVASVRDRGYAISISQPLLRGFGVATRAELTGARRLLQTADRRRGEAEQALVLAVAEAYFAVVGHERLLEATGRSRDRARRLREASERRAAVGLATQLDVFRADLFASQADAALAAQVEVVEESRDRLKRLVGRDVSSPLELDATGAIDMLVATTGSFDDIAALAAASLDARLDVVEARSRVDDARRAARVARWDLLPPVALDVSYASRRLGATSGLGMLGNGWHVGLSASYSLDRAAERATAASSSIAERSARREAGDVAERAVADVRRAHRAWSRSAETLAIHQRAADLAGKQLRLAELRYERGLAGNFDVVDAENNLFQAQSALIGAEIERGLSALRLRRAAGTLDPREFVR
jgi:outer membrane protein TolC